MTNRHTFSSAGKNRYFASEVDEYVRKSSEEYERLLKKIADTEAEIERIKSINVGPTASVQAMLEKYGSTPLKSGMKLSELVKRPELDYYKIAEIDPERPELPKNVTEQVNINLKYPKTE